MPASPRMLSLALLALLTPLTPAAAFAAAASASQQVNLRSGPATSYDVIGQLAAGQAVDVRQCEGKFCQVAYDGKTGWVSSSFLTRGTTAVATAAHAAPVPPAYTTAPPSEAPSANVAEVPEAGVAPRPRVDIPDTSMAPPSDDSDIASAQDPGDYDAFAAEDDGPDDSAVVSAPPDFGPPRFAPRGFARDFADAGNGPDRACFVDAVGGNGFCVREGERIDMPGRWARHAMLLRNPQRLNVTVCTLPDECRTYLASGPVLVGGRMIASISVAAPGY